MSRKPLRTATACRHAMHILKIIHGYPPDYNAGSEVYSKSVCETLAETERVSVFTREENPYVPDFSIRSQRVNANLTLYFVNNPQAKDGYRHAKMDAAFSNLVDELKPDIAYIGHLNHLSTGLVDVLYGRHIPIVFMLHDFWLMCPRGQFLTRSIGKQNNCQVCNGQRNEKCACDCYEVYFSGNAENREKEIAVWSEWIRCRMDVMKAIVSKVGLFVAPSVYLRNRFVDDFGVPSNKIIYLDYGFRTSALHPVPRLCVGSDYVFGYIGTHIQSKGVNILVEAFRRVKGHVKLKIFGRDAGQSTKALRRMAIGSCNQIEFLGEYENCNLVQDVFSHVDAIVVPSIWAENSPLVIHEAQACRLPVITADYGGMAEYVHHHENGLLFRHGDVDSLADQLQWAYDNPVGMKKLGARGYIKSGNGAVPDIGEHCKKLMELFRDELQRQ